MKRLEVVIIGTEERRAAINTLVRRAGACTVVGEVSTADALRLVVRLAPDLVILDGATPGINPLVALPALAGTHVIALAATSSAAEDRLLLELGAIGVARLEQPATLLRALEQSARLAAVVARPAPLGGLFGGAGKRTARPVQGVAGGL